MVRIHFPPAEGQAKSMRERVAREVGLGPRQDSCEDWGSFCHSRANPQVLLSAALPARDQNRALVAQLREGLSAIDRVARLASRANS